MDRDRLCKPLPHVFVHAVQELNGETSQWIGHGPKSQFVVSVSAPHATPPCAAAAVVARVRVRTPVAHDCEQSLHASQADCTQLKGQDMALQARVSDVDPQPLPPCANWRVMARERVWEPLSQDLVHEPYVPQLDTMQSTGHASLLHDIASKRYGHT